MAYKESKFNRLDAPVPGESLTSEPGNYPWENPPQYSKVSDGFLWVFNQMHKEPQLTQLISLLDTGVPVEALAKTLSTVRTGPGTTLPETISTKLSKFE